MRTEGNPIKKNPNLSGYKNHRIIMPVYIPYKEGYYKDAFDIFVFCLNSLINTVNLRQTNITIINNASIQEVDEFVSELFSRGKIDQYIKNSINRGKADAIVGTAKQSYEPFITFTDADVLFENNWQQYIEDGYKDFPSLGMICPFPAPYLKFYNTVSTWTGINPFSIKLKKIVKNEHLLFFANSVGKPNFLKKKDLDKQFHIKSKKNRNYLIGAGHFVATYRREVFDNMPYKPTSMGLKGGLKYIEKRIDELGYMHLSITEYKVHHMGNQLEPWIKAYYERIISSKTNSTSLMNNNLPKGEPKLGKYIPNFLFPFINKLLIYIISAIHKAIT